MSISPISGSQNPVPAHVIPPVVKKLDQVWNQWYNNPTAETGKTLLNFLTTNEPQLTKIVGTTPEPFGSGFKESFQMLYDHTLSNLSDWVDSYNPATSPEQAGRVSESIAYIYDWAKKACES